eukprot:CAMPEP_0177361816 /NCGR_PEP_ID=MMETSP0368-20130122/37378_1 /TAXON_ID=447022 ORGANISM="Scrippsiella hangoei-like, Strain SHHI-4" /NCGR_SAMPLE_ID=MMETSP0368 /ASSEMBLY_ACC=CAM_ASM_000363 /LENGTH=94 /DNA_ID=CAMNT_0018824475 /DNA_START=329 /DNA_END=613 /DNA_ORIENTATION=-
MTAKTASQKHNCRASPPPRLLPKNCPLQAEAQPLPASSSGAPLGGTHRCRRRVRRCDNRPVPDPTAGVVQPKKLAARLSIAPAQQSTTKANATL